MGHLKTLSIKSLLNGIPAIFILSTIGGLSFAESLVVALILTVIAYLIGDQLILPATNNTIATIADASLALLTLWLIQMMGYDITWSGILWTVASLALVESMIYHPYLERLASLDSLGPRSGDRN